MSSLRVRTILGELEKATAEFTEAKEQHVSSQARYDATRDKFITMRQLASEALSRTDWREWERGHHDVKYVGMQISEAIVGVLETHAYSSAFNHLDSKDGQTRYAPEMHVDRLVEELESGGFEFRSSTPGREINAAVLNRQDIEKVGRTGAYRTARYDELLQNAKRVVDEERQQGAAEP